MKEKLIDTIGGAKNGRRPDIIYLTLNGKLRGINVGRTLANGSPVPREVAALKDLNGPGKLPTNFYPYGRFMAMPDILIQFHATPFELLQLAKQYVANFGLHVVALKYFPFKAIELDPGGLDKSIKMEPEPFDVLAFTIDSPVLPATGKMDFVDKNPSTLLLEIMWPGKNGLRQTALSSRTDDAKAFDVWKTISKQLKGLTKAGVTVVNPDSGVFGVNKSHRYTEGAKALELHGVTMLAYAGGNIVKLEMPK